MSTHEIPESLAAVKAAGSVQNRLMSLDALRGFDMLWIIGAARVIKALNHWQGGPFLGWLTDQLEHVEWNGFHFEDLIFPLFLFISGVTMPFSLTKRIEQGVPRRALYWRIVRRVVMLVFLGMVYNGFFKFDWAHMRYASVLGRIGLAYGLAAMIVIHTDVRSQVVWMFGILLAYWAAMMLIPVPGVGAGVLTVEGSLAGYIDRHVLPGQLYLGVHDPEGLFSTIPAISTALLGALAGWWLRSARPRAALKVLGLALAGGAGLALGMLWNGWFPINKNLWTSSFVLYAGGWSLLLLAIFYLIIDVWHLQRWAFVFVVIGLNPITIYIAEGRLIDFQLPVRFLLGGALKHVGKAPQAVLFALAVLAVQWLFLYALYRKKVFLKV